MNAQSIADKINATGFALVTPLSRMQLNHVTHYLKDCTVHPGCHVTYSATGTPGPWGDSLSADVVSWQMHDIIRCPHLLEHALQFFDVAQAFLGVEVPLLYSLNAFCTRPVPHVRPDIQDWHRDADDVKFLPMFSYLTDVSDAEAQRLRGPFGEASIKGPAGTTFFSNTMEEHLGGKPVEGERIITWARWGVSDPPAAYVWDKLSPIGRDELGSRYPYDPRLQHAIHLVAA